MSATRKAKGTEAPPAAVKASAAAAASGGSKRATSATSKKRVAVAVVASEATALASKGSSAAEAKTGASTAGRPKAPAKTAARRVTKAPIAPSRGAPSDTQEPEKRETIAPESEVPESGLRLLRDGQAGKRREVSEASGASGASGAPLPDVAAPSVVAQAAPAVPAVDAAPVTPLAEPTREPVVEATPEQVDELARLLGDSIARTSDAWVHYQVVMTDLGPKSVTALVARARAVQAEGGLRFEGGEDTRRRTLGGVFFALAREEAGPVKWRELRKQARKRAVRKPPAPAKPVRFEPEVVMVRRRSAL